MCPERSADEPAITPDPIPNGLRRMEARDKLIETLEMENERLAGLAAERATCAEELQKQLNWAQGEIDRLLHLAQCEQEPMQAAVQYLRKDGGHGPGWITMAMFDGVLAAEAYCGLQRTDEKWPFKYRAVELSASAVTSTERSPQENDHG